MRTDIDRTTSQSTPTGISSGMHVTRSNADETAALRRAVLRPHLTIRQMTVAGDQDPDTAYLAVRALAGNGALIGCVRLEPVPCPWAESVDVDTGNAWQLRAMATDQSARGSGVGRLLVEAAVTHVADRGGTSIWCNARVGAEGFYSRLGFRTVTGRFTVSEVAEHHVGMVRPVQSPGRADPCARPGWGES